MSSRNLVTLSKDTSYKAAQPHSATAGLYGFNKASHKEQDYNVLLWNKICILKFHCFLCKVVHILLIQE